MQVKERYASVMRNVDSLRSRTKEGGQRQITVSRCTLAESSEREREGTMTSGGATGVHQPAAAAMASARKMIMADVRAGCGAGQRSLVRGWAR